MPELGTCFHQHQHQHQHQQHTDRLTAKTATRHIFTTTSLGSQLSITHQTHQTPTPPPSPFTTISASQPPSTSQLQIRTFKMAATTFFTTTTLVNYGRSGYNKGNSDDDNEEGNKLRDYGRSGYNKDDKDDEENKQH